MAQNLNTVAVVNTTVEAAAKPARKAHASKKKSVAPLVLEHTATTTLGEVVVGTMPDPGQDMLEALIDSLDGAGPQDDEVIEPAADAAPAVIDVDAKVIEIPDDGLDALLSQLDSLPIADTAAPAIETTLTDAEVESAVATIEVREAMLAAATPEGVIGSATPTGDASDVSADDLSAAASEGAADGASVKRTPTPRKHWTDKVERLKDRMGESMGEYSVLTLDDAGVDPEALKSRMEETLAIIKGMNKKEQARAGFLIEFVSGQRRPGGDRTDVAGQSEAIEMKTRAALCEQFLERCDKMQHHFVDVEHHQRLVPLWQGIDRGPGGNRSPLQRPGSA